MLKDVLNKNLETNFLSIQTEINENNFFTSELSFNYRLR